MRTDEREALETFLNWWLAEAVKPKARARTHQGHGPLTIAITMNVYAHVIPELQSP